MLTDCRLVQVVEQRRQEAEEADRSDGLNFCSKAYDDYVLQAFVNLMDCRFGAARRNRGEGDSASPRSRRTSSFSPQNVVRRFNPIQTPATAAVNITPPRVEPPLSPSPPRCSSVRRASATQTHSPLLPAFSPTSSSPVTTPTPPSRNTIAPRLLTAQGLLPLPSSSVEPVSVTPTSGVNPSKRRKISAFEASFLASIVEAIRSGVTDRETVIGHINDVFYMAQPFPVGASVSPVFTVDQVTTGDVIDVPLETTDEDVPDVPLETTDEDVPDVPLENASESVTNAPLESPTDNVDAGVMLTASPAVSNLDGSPTETCQEMEIDRQPPTFFGDELDGISQPDGGNLALENSEAMRGIATADTEDIDNGVVAAGEIGVMESTRAGQGIRGSGTDGEHAASRGANNDPVADMDNDGGSMGDVVIVQSRKKGAEGQDCDEDAVSEEEDNVGRKPPTRRILNVVLSDDEDNDGSGCEHGQGGRFFEESEEIEDDDVSDIDVDALEPWEEEEDVQYVGSRQVFQPPISSFPVIPPDVETLSEDLLSQLRETM